MGSPSLQGGGEQILKEKTDQEQRSFHSRLPCMEISDFCFLLQMVFVSVCGWLSWYRAGKAFKMYGGKLKQSQKGVAVIHESNQATVAGKPVYAQYNYFPCFKEVFVVSFLNRKIFTFLKRTLFP